MSFISRHVNSKMVAYAIVAFVVAYILHTFFPALVSLGRFIVSVLSPFLIAVILYYLFRPLVNLLRKRLSIYGAIIVSFVVLFGFMTFVIVFIYPAIVDQVDVLKQANLEHISSEGQDGETLFHYKNFTFKVSDKIRGYIVQGLRDLNLVTLQSISNFFSSLAKFLFALALSPFVLFYLLKDDTKIARGIEHLFPSRHQPQVRQFLVEVDHMLNHFIEGRFIIAFICSVLLLIGFLIIGIDMPVILSLVSLLFYIIPTFGCFLAMILPIFVGFSMNVSIGIETTILVASVAAVEGLYISNLVMGKTLFIHPLTVILILLIGGAMGGIIGLLFAIPAYLFLKLLFIYLYRNIQATQP